MIASPFQALIVPAAALPAQVAAANTLNDQGVQLWQRGRRSEAVAAFNEAARADGRFAVPWHNLGAIYLIEGQFPQAVSAHASGAGVLTRGQRSSGAGGVGRGARAGPDAA
jgi:Flp pilus assembly protein TadD